VNKLYATPQRALAVVDAAGGAGGGDPSPLVDHDDDEPSPLVELMRAAPGLSAGDVSDAEAALAAGSAAILPAQPSSPSSPD
jgi:hypothetical protein